MTTDATVIPTDISVTEALATVPFTRAVRQFYLDLYSGKPSGDRVFVYGVSKPESAPDADLLAWRGRIPGAVGEYGVASLYDAQTLDLDDPALAYGTGLTASRAAKLASVFMEADDISLDEQASRLDHLEAHTGIQGMAVLTGDTRAESIGVADVAVQWVKPGKSIHYHLPIVMIDPTDIEAVALWKGCCDMLAAIMMGDISVAGDLARKSRVGGIVAGDFNTGVRIQSYIRRPGSPLLIGDLHERLRGYCRDIDIDVDGRLRALRVAREAKLSARSRERAVRDGEVPDGCTVEEATEQANMLRQLHDDIIQAEAVTDEQEALVRAHPRWVRRTSPSPSGPSGGGGGGGGRRFVYGVFDFDGSTRAVDFTSLVVPGSDATLADRGAGLAGRDHAWVRCPIHGDSDASSKLWRGRDGLLRMRCYAGCGEIHDAATDGPTEEGGLDIDELLDCIGGPGETSTDRDEEEAAERAAARAADEKLGLDEARERVRRTLVAADRLAPEHVEAARHCCTVARGWVADIRERWLAEGLPRAKEPCGWLQGLRNASNGRARVHYRGCGSFSCPECGPERVARKAAAILHMPIVKSSDEGDRVVGRTMVERGAFLSFTDAKGLVSFRARFSRATRKLDVTEASSPGEEDGSVTSTEQAHSWVAFHLGERIAILCTLSLPGRGQPDPQPIPGGPDLGSVAAFETLVRGLIMQTYEVEPGQDGLPPVVVGKVTSSQGLTLDPRKVASLASGSRWVVEADKVRGHKQVKEELERMGIPFVEQQREDNKLPTTITTAPLTAEQATALWSALRVETSNPSAEDFTGEEEFAVPTPPDLDLLLADILAA